MKYTNPIIPGFYPDPSICRVGEDYYLVTSSFEYFPGVPIFHSRNLVNWQQIGHCLTRPSQLPLDKAGISGGIFAPTLRYHDGRFYMVTTNITNGGHFYVWTEDPAGEWSEPVWIDAVGIDPDLFWDDDGRVIFSSDNGKGQVSLQREIDLETGKETSELSVVEAMCGGKCPEAPHVYRIGNYYYLLIAEGGTEYGHCITIARGPSATGPWEHCPHNPILSHRSTNSPIQGTGHADLVEDHKGNWWMVCLGIRPQSYQPYHVLGRETFITPVIWQDGWPIVGNNGQIALEMDGHDGLPNVQAPTFDTKDTFNSPTLPLHWNFIGNPDDSCIANGDGKLSLRCAKPDLNTMHGQAWVGRRQQHFRFRATARFEFQPQADNEEAGITVFQNIRHHYEIARTQRQGKQCLIVRRTIGSLTAEVAEYEHAGDVCTLSIEGDPWNYRFSVLNSAGETVELASGEARYLSTEVGGKFTGVYLAMYATANGKESQNQAHFDSFDYTTL